MDSLIKIYERVDEVLLFLGFGRSRNVTLLHQGALPRGTSYRGNFCYRHMCKSCLELYLLGLMPRFTWPLICNLDILDPFANHVHNASNQWSSGRADGCLTRGCVFDFTRRMLELLPMNLIVHLMIVAVTSLYAGHPKMWIPKSLGKIGE